MQNRMHKIRIEIDFTSCNIGAFDCGVDRPLRGFLGYTTKHAELCSNSRLQAMSPGYCSFKRYAPVTSFLLSVPLPIVLSLEGPSPQHRHHHFHHRFHLLVHAVQHLDFHGGLHFVWPLWMLHGLQVHCGFYLVGEVPHSLWLGDAVLTSLPSQQEPRFGFAMNGDERVIERIDCHEASENDDENSDERVIEQMKSCDCHEVSENEHLWYDLNARRIHAKWYETCHCRQNSLISE